MSSGRIDVRLCKNGKYRLRFYAIASDQKTTILQALDQARLQLGTQFDGVALEMICLAYLAGCTAVLQPASPSDV